MNLSPKYGVNPSIKACFWCSKPTDEILLLGDHYKRGQEAPMYLVTDYEPCQTCLDAFAQGILIVEATEEPQHVDQQKLDQGYPTGCHWVVTRDFITRTFEESAAKQILKAGKAMIGHELAEMLGFFNTDLAD